MRILILAVLLLGSTPGSFRNDERMTWLASQVATDTECEVFDLARSAKGAERDRLLRQLEGMIRER